jgi:type VI secretion system protein ImpF
MNSRSASRTRFHPTLFQRLFDDAPRRPVEDDPLRRWSMDELKASVAGDLESLLNSRAGLTEEMLQAYPAAGTSVLSFGMCDFVGRSLASPADRSHICRTLERTIGAHEPRLRNIKVGLAVDERAVNVLHFSISAVLVVHPAQEPVSFDALLQPTIQQYSVAAGRPMSGPAK